MKRTLIALGCGLVLAIGTASAQQGPTMTEKAKEAAQNIGEKAKDAMEKVKDMAQESARKSKADDDRKAASPAPSGRIERMQKQADADFKSAMAKCDPIEPRVQRTVCEKQAAVAHANAELRIAKADAAAQPGKTSTMGAGKAAR